MVSFFSLSSYWHLIRSQIHSTLFHRCRFQCRNLNQESQITAWYTWPINLMGEQLKFLFLFHQILYICIVTYVAVFKLRTKVFKSSLSIKFINYHTIIIKFITTQFLFWIVHNPNFNHYLFPHSYVGQYLTTISNSPWILIKTPFLFEKLNIFSSMETVFICL